MNLLQTSQENIDTVQSGPVIIQPVTPYTFHAAKLGIKRLSINAGIREHMDHSTDFKNFILQAITLFMSDPLRLEWECPLPDHMIGDVGISYVTIHRFENIGDRFQVKGADMEREYLPVIADQEIHVMV